MKQITGYSHNSFWIDGVEYQANEEQEKLLAALIDLNVNPPEEENIHAQWHSCPQYEGESGYEYGEKLQTWAQDKPQVKVFRFDDNMFMSSVGFIIPASSKYEHMGFNVVICPQASKPIDFFLYPHHANSLFKALTSAINEAKDMPRINPDKPSNKTKNQIKQQIFHSWVN